jgi:hypothetical protein
MRAVDPERIEKLIGSTAAIGVRCASDDIDLMHGVQDAGLRCE